MVAYSFKHRFVAPIQVGLGQQPHIPGTEYMPKRQTIRAIGKRRHARPGETLQIYHGMRSKQCFKIGEAVCTVVLPIKMMVGKHTLCVILDSASIKGGHIHDFARADGFASGEEMLAFWHDEHPGVTDFNGVLIKWRPIQ